MVSTFQTHRLDRSTERIHSRIAREPSAVRRFLTAITSYFFPYGFKESLQPPYRNRTVLRLVGAGAIIGILYFSFLWITLPNISDPRSFLASQSTVVTDRNGTELYRFFQDQDRTYIEGELIPQHIKDAVVAIEDERYYDRGCLDIRALARVVFRFGQSGGASTITRQLARTALNLTQDNIINRKFKELILGCQMEHSYGKDELLVLYLNWIPFGRNAYGVEQASHEYFGISAKDLTLGQSVILAALPQRPTYFSPYGAHVRTTVTEEAQQKIMSGKYDRASDIKDEEIAIGLLGAEVGSGATAIYLGGRTDQVLANMEEQGKITEQERLAALAELESIEFAPSREDIRSPHFVLWVREQAEQLLAGTAEAGLLERGGLTIETTLDWDMQQAAEASVENYRQDALDRFGVHNIALLSVDPDTRQILAYVGNADYSDEEHGGKIDMVQVPRQPGSSFKPFVYAAAFEQGYNPATVLFDAPTKIGDNTPQNFDGTFWGPITIRQALGGSRNIPAAKAFFLGGGEDSILRLVSSMGVTTPLAKRAELTAQRGEPFEYGWPLALGAGETPLIEMVNGYAAFADGGVAKPIVSILKIKDKNGNILYEPELDTIGEQALDERIAYQITSVLSDESVRPNEYWKSQLTVPGYQTAAKTGTSNKCLEWKDEFTCLLRKPDNGWTLGYTPSLVTGVWIGNADSSALFEKADGLNTASPIWRDYMMKAHRLMENTAATFTVPAGIVQAQISTLSGELPTECTPVELRKADVFLQEKMPTKDDPACAQLMIDKVTGLLASDACPSDATASGSFFIAHSILADRWPEWEKGVQEWVKQQMVIWNSNPTHTGSLLKLPVAPTEECDPSLTPGRLVKPTVSIETPQSMASYPAFSATIDISVGSKVREARYYIDDKLVSTSTAAPFNATIRVPRSIEQEGSHELRVELIDEYYNKAEDSVTIQFGEDEGLPDISLVEPTKTVFKTGEQITIRATASDADSGIKYVQFYLDDKLLSTKPQSPYQVTYSIDTPGTYTLRATAEDMTKHISEDQMSITVE